jgi:perosamine synthetase
VKAENRDRLIEHLKGKGVSASVHYIPNHHYDIYKRFRSDVPATDRVWKKIVTLPLYPDMTDSEIGQVVEAVKGFKN